MPSPEVLISAGQLVFSIVLAGVTIWYALETGKLRKTGEKQAVAAERQTAAMEASIELTKASFDAGLLPYLILGILKASEDVWKKHETRSKLGYISLPGFGRAGRSVTTDRDYIFSVLNVTDKIASHIFMIYFDSGSKKVFVSCIVAESIGPREELTLPISRDPVGVEDIIYLVDKIFEGRASYLTIKNSGGKSIIERYAAADEGHILAIFFDLAGKLYAIPRLVVESSDGGDFVFGKSDLIQEKVTFFAPTFETSRARSLSR